MTDTLTPTEIRRELVRRLPMFSGQQIEDLTRTFVDLAAGKYVVGSRWVKRQRNAVIRNLYDGTNLIKLAEVFHLSARQLRRLTEK